MTASEHLLVESETLRKVMGRVPTGVMVVTTATADGQAARTANSFGSVSLDPPLVSVCFGATSPFVTALRDSGRWGVSVLAADQHELSRHFAHGPRTLDGIAHHLGPHTSAALLDDAVATMECHSLTMQQAGDHVLVLAEVVSLAARRDTPPLIFYRGGYHQVGPATD